MPIVLFVHHRPQPSGAARSLALLIGALGAEWDAHVLVPGGGAAEIFAEAGATVHRAPVPAFTHTWDVHYHGLRWLVALRELAAVPPHARALSRLLHELKPDVVHLNDSVMIASAAIARHAKAPVVWHLRSSLAFGGNGSRSRWIARQVDRTASAVIAIDTDVAASFPIRTAVAVIPNPVLAEEGEPAQLDLPEGRLAVGFFGYLRRQKGWAEFLEALRLLADRQVPVHGVVVGGGVRPPSAFRGLRGRSLEALGIPDEQGAFERRTRELRLEGVVTQRPFTRDIGAIYRALDIVVFPNQGEGLGRPVIEAAAYGLPVVASGSADGGGVLVPDVTGVLLAHGTPDELADALGRLASDPALIARLGSAALRHAARAAPMRVAQQVEAVWRDVVGRSGGRESG
ncbi:MAG: glycosyltransferase family 4 protein [Actinobacteria bacterium]|nr:glycosyltransferase family 4 protein [Actinomycetota bacterium]